MEVGRGEGEMEGWSEGETERGRDGGKKGIREFENKRIRDSLSSTR